MNVFPSFATLDSIYGGALNAVSLCQYLAFLCAIEYFQRLPIGYLGRIVPFSTPAIARYKSMNNIFFLRHIFKVAQAIICSVAVLVVDALTLGGCRKKCHRHKLMNINFQLNLMAAKSNPKVTVLLVWMYFAIASYANIGSPYLASI